MGLWRLGPYSKKDPDEEIGKKETEMSACYYDLAKAHVNISAVKLESGEVFELNGQKPPDGDAMFYSTLETGTQINMSTTYHGPKSMWPIKMWLCWA